MEEDEVYLIRNKSWRAYDNPYTVTCKRVTKTSYLILSNDKSWWVSKEDIKWPRWYESPRYQIIEKL